MREREREREVGWGVCVCVCVKRDVRACDCREEAEPSFPAAFSLLVCKHVQSPSELLSAEQGHEGSGRRNTTYGGLMRFYLEGLSKKG